MQAPRIFRAMIPPSRLNQYSARWRGFKRYIQRCQRSFGRVARWAARASARSARRARNRSPNERFNLIVLPLLVVIVFLARLRPEDLFIKCYLFPHGVYGYYNKSQVQNAYVFLLRYTRHMKLKLSEELKWRGLVNQTTYKDLSALDKGPITFYWGVDPSADSMTVGNMAAAMMVKLFIKYGHKPVLLVGGATGMIGDPDGKSSERELLEPKTLERNKQAIVEQYHRLFGGAELQIVDNYDWFKSMGYLQFLREVGKHVPTRQMLAREFVQNRLGEQGNGISYAEFSYVLIQAYDFLYMYQNMAVTLQVCGSDQWGNCIAGVDLIRRKTGGEAHVYSAPLVTNQSTGQKFGKTEEGAVWLDPAKTTPTQFYQFWVNTDDASVENYLKIFTELDKNEVQKIIAEHQQAPERRLAQTRLAQEVTKLVHGEHSVKIAQEVK